MKTSPITILLFAALASACADNAYRCFNPAGSTQDDSTKTAVCSSKLGLVLDSCYCSNRAEYFVEVPEETLDAFKACCGTTEGATITEC